MTKTVIVGYSRTPIGSFLGCLNNIKATDLGAAAIKGAIEKYKINTNIIDEVIMGQVLSAGSGQAPARQASLAAGISNNVPCTTINKVCGSGLQSIILAYQAIMTQEYNTIIAGGMENMSQSPYMLLNSRKTMKMGNKHMIDSMIHDGLWDPYSKMHMGNLGDLCAEKYNISRSEQDLFAEHSYKRALMTTKENIFDNEITPIICKTKPNKQITQDEELNNFNLQKMINLKSIFNKKGTITVANASKINDGAAAVILMNETKALSLGIKPIAEILSIASFAQHPSWFTTAPIYSIQKACKKININIKDINLFEINEAFAVVPIVTMKKLHIPHDKVNIFGGAVALGHPIGCSGARIVCTLLNSMQYKQAKLGCASICIGGGSALSIIIKYIG